MEETSDGRGEEERGGGGSDEEIREQVKVDQDINRMIHYRIKGSGRAKWLEGGGLGGRETRTLSIQPDFSSASVQPRLSSASGPQTQNLAPVV